MPREDNRPVSARLQPYIANLRRAALERAEFQRKHMSITEFMIEERLGRGAAVDRAVKDGRLVKVDGKYFVLRVPVDGAKDTGAA